MTLTDDARAGDPENTLVMETEHGAVVIEMFPDVAPNHVARIKELTRQGFYDGIVFHRVMDGFMAQTGDPTGTGSGGSGQNIDAEFSTVPFERGTVGMARAQSPNSGDSQFFIMFAEGSFLNGQYTVWGKVVEGMDAVDQIKKAPAGSQSGQVTDPDHIVSMKVQADIQ
jgi:peptidylprolyl isomerase